MHAISLALLYFSSFSNEESPSTLNIPCSKSYNGTEINVNLDLKL
uniref:Uncharacterized protein n=1 Tax=Cannabis sativa TaxID=3483 RepID=A0A803R577_CANSA